MLFTVCITFPLHFTLNIVQAKNTLLKKSRKDTAYCLIFAYRLKSVFALARDSSIFARDFPSFHHKVCPVEVSVAF